MWIALVGAFLTAAYTVRATYLTFFGEPRGARPAPTDSHDAHEIPDDAALGARPDGPRRTGLTSSRRASSSRPTPDGQAGVIAVALEEEADPDCPVTDHVHDPHGGGHDDHEHDEHHPPHESPQADPHPHLHPRRARRPRGFANATPFGEQWENSRSTSSHGRRPSSRPPPRTTPRPRRRRRPARGRGDRRARRRHAAGCGYEEPAAGRPATSRPSTTPSSSGPRPLLSLLIVAAGLVVELVRLCVALYTARSDRRLVGLTERSRPCPLAGYLFLANKYYLDVLYEGVIVRGHRPPDRLGGQLGQPERHRRRSSTPPVGPAEATSAVCAYRNIDQRGRRRGGQRLRLGRQWRRHGAAARAVGQGQPVRCVCSSGRRPSAPSCS